MYMLVALFVSSLLDQTSSIKEKQKIVGVRCWVRMFNHQSLCRRGRRRSFRRRRWDPGSFWPVIMVKDHTEEKGVNSQKTLELEFFPLPSLLFRVSQHSHMLLHKILPIIQKKKIKCQNLKTISAITPKYRPFEEKELR